MSRKYEAMYIFDSTLEDAAITEKLGRFHGLLGSLPDLETKHWGRRQFAYPIGRRDTGYYVEAHFSAEPPALPEFERALKLDDGVVRYLLTVFEHEVGAPPMSEEELAAARLRREQEEEEDEE